MKGFRKMKKREASVKDPGGLIGKDRMGILTAFVRPALITAIGAAVCPARFLFGSAPFASAFICSVSGPLSVPAALLGAVVGSFASGDAAFRVPVFFSLFLGRLVICLILSRDGGNPKEDPGSGGRVTRLAAECIAARYDESVYIRMVLSSVACLAGGVLHASLGGEGTAGFISAAASSVISPVLVWLFTSSPVWEKVCPGGGSGARDSMLREAGTTALCAAAALSFYAFRIPVVDLGIVAVFVITVVSVRKSGTLAGMLRGFVSGALISPRAASLFAVCAVVCGVVERFSDTGSVLSSAAAGIMWSYSEVGLDVLSETVPEMIVGVAVLAPAVAFGFIPRTVRRRPGPARRGQPEGDGIPAGGPTEKKLSELSRGLFSVSRELNRISGEMMSPAHDDVIAICDATFEEVCAGCGMRHACREAERTEAEKVRDQIASQLLREGRASASAVSRALAKRCFNIDRIIDGVNEKYSVRTAEARFFDRTSVIASDYEAVAEMLKDTARYDREEARIDGKLTTRLASMLPDGGFFAENVTVYGKRRKRAVAVGVRIPRTALGSEQIRELFGDACGIKFSDPAFSICGETLNMELLPLPKIRADHGGASICAKDGARSADGKRGEYVCGDVIKTFETGDERLYMLISDGMGSGKEAFLTAELCASFLNTVLTAGVTASTALKMLNSVVRARGTECSATVDLAEIDLLTGKARFIKSGAAPSFVVRGGRLFRLQSKTVPIGIIRALDAEIISFDVEPGDIVVMLSDGVTRSFEEAPWLCEMLSEDGLTGRSPEELAGLIVRRAEENGSRDDITAGIVKIR